MNLIQKGLKKVGKGLNDDVGDKWKAESFIQLPECFCMHQLYVFEVLLMKIVIKIKENDIKETQRMFHL